MKAGSATTLERILEEASDALEEVGSMTPQDAARAHIRNYDRLYLHRNGIRVPPEGLRMLADECEAIAREYRVVADQREREAS